MSTPTHAPTPEQIDRLPKWAQDHIQRLQRERDSAVHIAKFTIDQQTPSSVYTEEIGSLPVAKFIRRYLQCNWSVTIETTQLKLHVSFFDDDKLSLTYSSANGFSAAAIIPKACNAIDIVPLP